MVRPTRLAATGPQGAALLTVLAFMTLTFMLIATLLALTSDEMLLSGIQRDGVRALDLAQAGAQEAIRRMEGGRPYLQEFSASLDTNGTAPPNTSVTVARRHTGVQAGYLEIQSTATAGLSTRRLTVVALQRAIAMLPNAVLAQAIVQEDGTALLCGDVYARTFVRYLPDPNRAAPGCPGVPPGQPGLTYAGWRIGMCADPSGLCGGVGEVPPCSQMPCPPSPAADTSRWYPAARLAVPADSPTGRVLAAMTNRCPAGGGGSLPEARITGRLAGEQSVADHPQYGFDVDDPDGPGPVPPQAIIPGVLPCGLPYRYDLMSFLTEDGQTVQRYAKTVVFEHWFPLYWRFDEHRLSYVRRTGAACADPSCLVGGVEPDLAGYPQFGAIPPVPPAQAMTANFDCRREGGGMLGGSRLSCDHPAGKVSAFGCKAPEMACSPVENRPLSLVLTGNWILSGLAGHGTLIVDGDLTVAGGVRYWGAVVVSGDLTLRGSGTAIRGGLTVSGILHAGGSVMVEGGGTTPSPPLGRSIVTVRGWWER